VMATTDIEAETPPGNQSPFRRNCRMVAMGFLSNPLRRNHPTLAAVDRFSNFRLLSTPCQFHKNRQRRSRYVNRFIISCRIDRQSPVSPVLA